MPDVTPAAKPLLPAMRWWFLLDSFLVFVTGIQLFLLTEFTDRFFAWTIAPPLTAAFLGASYWAAFPLVFLAARETLWARARIAVYGVLAFTTLTTIATFLHLDRFHLTSPQPLALGATWAWLIVYVVVPPTILILIWRQQQAPGGDPSRAAPLPIWVRGILVAQSALLILAGIALFVAPHLAPTVWPWPLTPLTSRAVGAWLIGIGLIAGQAAWENDWTRLRGMTLGYILLGVLHLLAALRYGATVQWDSPTAWLYVLILVSFLVVGGYGWLVGVRATNRITRPSQGGAGH